VGLDIHFAKIATEKSQALDVFYVSDQAGNKLMPEAMAELESRMLAPWRGPGEMRRSI